MDDVEKHFPAGRYVCTRLSATGSVRTSGEIKGPVFNVYKKVTYHYSAFLSRFFLGTSL